LIIPDVNLLIHAHNRRAPHHEVARAWWADLLTRESTVGMPWAVTFGFVRLVTHPRVLQMPLSAGEALDRVDSWLACAGVIVLDPGPRHLRICRELFDALGVAASLTTDVHLAALAIENQAELHSNDADFRRFPGLRWRDPTST
jgi:toxin-antitoxin system PIN domain toxin